MGFWSSLFQKIAGQDDEIDEQLVVNTAITDHPPVTGSVVFLDIDGVLHPGTSETLKYLPNFCRVLDQYPSLQVVICSNWRETATFEYLQSLFSVQYRHRIVGVTPSLRAEQGVPRRELEIREFLKKNQINHWFVIDDEPDRYGTLPPDNIFITDSLTALDDYKTTELIAWMRSRFHSFR